MEACTAHTRAATVRAAELTARTGFPRCAWLPLRSDDFYAESHIDLRLKTEVAKIDPRATTVALADGAALPYDRLLLATGAEPVRLPTPGAELPHVHVLRTLADCRATIDRFVETVRSNTSDRLVSVARLVVYGLLAAIMGTAALVLIAIALIRFLHAYLPGGVWSAELVVGGLFAVGGLFLWQQASKRPRDNGR